MVIEDCYGLGFVYKAQGIAGELVIKTELEQSEETILKWESIFLSIDGILVPFFIEDIFLKSNNLVVVKLEDVEDEIDAQKYRGLDVFVDKKLYQSVKSEEGFVQWISYQITDQTYGLIGELIEVQDFPAQIMLYVLSANKQTFLIPANFDWIQRVDDEKKFIEMQLPEGLLELNQ